MSLELRREIVYTCLQLREMGYIIGTYGNLSARVHGGLLITPSRMDYDTMRPDDLVVVSLEGERLEGARLPSSEMEVHRQIYVRRPDIGAVIHTHSFYATALSCARRCVPVIVEEQSQVVGDELRCTNYVPAGQHRQLGEEVAGALGESNGVLLANHGVVACGRDLADALLTAQVVERVAHMWLLAQAAGGAVPIPGEHVRSERDRWLHKYGSPEDGVLRPAAHPGERRG